MKKKILITGCSGFIGNYLVKKFLNNGYEVFGISSKNNKNIKTKNYLKKTYNKKKILDFLNKSNIQYIIFSHGSINHKASYDEVYKDHFLFTKLIIDCTRKKNLKKIIFLSSGDEYGGPLKKLPIDENTTCRPNSNYGLIKNHTSNYLINYFQNYKISIYILRLFLIYGHDQKKPRLIPSLKDHIQKNIVFNVNSTNQLKDFSHISDLYFYINKMLLSKKLTQDIFNFGSKNKFTIKQIITLIEKKYQKKLLMKLSKNININTYSSYPNITKLENSFDKKKFHKLSSKNI